MATSLKNLIREPLVQFLVLGAGVFVLFDLIADRRDVDPDEIVVGAGQIERMSQAWRKTRMRPPTRLELEGLIEDYIQEEIMYREAIALGLDRDNAVIRRHLRQKMEFLSEDIAAQIDPDEADLQAFLDENPDRFRQDALFSFRHIYFSRDKRGDATEADARTVLGQMGGPGNGSEIAVLGDSLPLPQVLQRVAERDVASQFGSEFAQSLLSLETGHWIGPVNSGFGLHLVFIEERIDARVPELFAVRGAVIREWRENQRQEVNAAFYAGLRTRYTIVVERPEWLEVELDIDGVEQR